MQFHGIKYDFVDGFKHKNIDQYQVPSYLILMKFSIYEVNVNYPSGESNCSN